MQCLPRTIFSLFNFYCCSVAKSCLTLWDSVTVWTEAHQASLSFTISQSLLKFLSIELVMLSNHLILCRPFSSCPQIFNLIRGKSIPLLHGLCWDVCCQGTVPWSAKPSCVANSAQPDLSVQGLIWSDKGSFFTYTGVQEDPMSKPFQ